MFSGRYSCVHRGREPSTVFAETREPQAVVPDADVLRDDPGEGDVAALDSDAGAQLSDM